jgi:toxin YhaV
MSASKPAPLVIHGWTIFAHPLFLKQLDALTQQVEAFKRKGPVGYVKKNANKRLAAITKLAFDVIPQDPTRMEYRHGGTLGDEHKHWFRAKFFQQYRLFFRYHVPSKVIVFAGVNDEDTKRAYESSDDAYRVFRKMLASGHPPDDWDQLLKEATPAVEDCSGEQSQADTSARQTLAHDAGANHGRQQEGGAQPFRCQSTGQRHTGVSPIACISRLIAVLSNIVSGKFTNTCTRPRICRNTLLKAARLASSLPSTAAGSSKPQCAEIGCPGHTGQTSPAALSQTVRMKSSCGASGWANSSQLLLRRLSIG